MARDIESVLNAIEKEENGENAVDILKIGTYFFSSPIVSETFSTLIEDAQKLKGALKVLVKHSLIETCWNLKIIRVKEKVQEEIRSFLREKNEEKSVLKKALKLLSESPVFEKMVRGVIWVITFSKKYPELIEEHSSLPVRILKVLKSLANLAAYNGALLLGSEAFKVWRECLGEFHCSTISLQFVLADMLMSCGKYDRALELSTELYEKEYKIRGIRAVTPTLKMIANLKLKKTRPESEAELKNLVFGKVTVSETKNNSVLSVWDKYATLLVEHDFTDEALKILRQVLKRRYELLSPDDDDIDEVKYSMAIAYFNVKKFAKGLDLLESIYNRRKLRFGEWSLKTLAVRFMVAQGYDEQEKKERALSVFEDVAEKLRQVIGKSSIMYISTLSRMGKINFAMRRYVKSYAIYAEMYELRKSHLVEDDDICTFYKRLMIVSLEAQGKDSEAEDLKAEECVGPENFELVLRLIMLEIYNSDIPSNIYGEFDRNVGIYNDEQH